MFRKDECKFFVNFSKFVCYYSQHFIFIKQFFPELVIYTPVA